MAHGADARAQSAPSTPTPTPTSTASTWMSVGATTFAAAYLASALTATTDYYTDGATSSKRTDLWVPVFGPLDQIGKTRSAGFDVLLVLDAVAELGGLAIFGYGVAESMGRPQPASPAASATARPLVLHLASLPACGSATVVGAAVAATF
jgi:hypothetical protein